MSGTAPSGSTGPGRVVARDPFRPVVVLLIVAIAVAIAVESEEGLRLLNPVLLDGAASLAIGACLLVDVVFRQAGRARAPRAAAAVPEPKPAPEPDPGPEAQSHVPADVPTASRVGAEHWRHLLDLARERVQIRPDWLMAAAAVVCVLLDLWWSPAPTTSSPNTSIVAGVLALLAVGFAATAARYFAATDPDRLPEGLLLSRGARTLAWVSVATAASVGLSLTDVGMLSTVTVIHDGLVTLNVLACADLIAGLPRVGVWPWGRVDLRLVSVFGSRANLIASILDAGERQLGIDLRSTWALLVIRRSLEPLGVGFVLAAWMSTSLTVIGPEEAGLIEHFGTPAAVTIGPGLHLRWPWPIDQVARVPVTLVQTIHVGHEGEESEGPENVLWAVEHAENEYTLVLGNGRDLITIDAAVQYRIRDPRAWHYQLQNPEDALRAISYRAVMKNTVNHTLEEALSENIVNMTSRIRAQVQRDADALGLGVEVLGFTVGGMHPPVPVAPDYQHVVSAERGKVTAVVNAQAYRNAVLPATAAEVLAAHNQALADGAVALATAAGQAWSFRALEAQYRAAPQEYTFRRRIEALEDALRGRSYTVVDSRIQRDGGELWIVP